MVRTAACPAITQWQRLLCGDLPESDAEALAEHVEGCPACLETVRNTSAPEDTLVMAVRTMPLDQAVSPKEQQLIDQLLRHQPGDASGSTKSADLAETQLNFELETSSQGPGAELYDFLSPAETPDELGRLGPYRILQLLGSGGMGMVFLAQDSQLKRRVALKVMRLALSTSESARQRFLREAQAMASVEHDHIVQVFQVGLERGIPYLSMPLLKGENLSLQARRLFQLRIHNIRV